MDAKNYEYLKDKVARYEMLNHYREKISFVQEELVKDEHITIILGNVFVKSSHDLSDSHFQGLEEHDELMREIKDNLIDSIGMKIVEINEKMEAL